MKKLRIIAWTDFEFDPDNYPPEWGVTTIEQAAVAEQRMLEDGESTILDYGEIDNFQTKILVVPDPEQPQLFTVDHNE